MPKYAGLRAVLGRGSVRVGGRVCGVDELLLYVPYCAEG